MIDDNDFKQKMGTF